MRALLLILVSVNAFAETATIKLVDDVLTFQGIENVEWNKHNFGSAQVNLKSRCQTGEKDSVCTVTPPLAHITCTASHVSGSETGRSASLWVNALKDKEAVDLSETYFDTLTIEYKCEPLTAQQEKGATPEGQARKRKAMAAKPDYHGCQSSGASTWLIPLIFGFLIRRKNGTTTDNSFSMHASG